MRLLLLFSVFLLLGVHSFAQIFYVHPEGKGNGMSWDEAASDLALILAQTEAGDEIWVAAGTYTATRSGDRNISFVIPNGVSVFGGFSGQETMRKQRDWSKNPTILSGEIGAPGEDDNTFNVVYTENVGPATRLDGFIIMGGNANGQVPKGGRIRGGGGWHDMAANGGKSRPHISNCTFLANKALEGGAFYCNGEDGSSSPIFSNCRFQGNFANVDGGAIFSNGRSESTSQVKLFNCIFQDNMASYGAGIFFDNGFNETGLTVENCIFKKNNAFLWGGGIYYSYPVGGDFDFQMHECHFESNYPTDVNKESFLSESDRGLAKK